MSLPNLQAELAEMILTNAKADTISLEQNILIYRNNIVSTLMLTLKNAYPLIYKLLGDDFFRLTAKEYIKLYPSRSSNLNDYGVYFSHFLAEYPPVKNFMYLAEVADFEWICHGLYLAADHPPLDTRLLENIWPGKYAVLHFVLHPACQVVKFHYPILSIIDLCEGNPETEVNLNAGPIYLLIIRREFDIKLLPLTLAEFTFLHALQEGLSVAQALAGALQKDAAFNLEEKLPQWVQDKTLVDCYLQKDEE